MSSQYETPPLLGGCVDGVVCAGVCVDAGAWSRPPARRRRLRRGAASGQTGSHGEAQGGAKDQLPRSESMISHEYPFSTIGASPGVRTYIRNKSPNGSLIEVSRIGWPGIGRGALPANSQRDWSQPGCSPACWAIRLAPPDWCHQRRTSGPTVVAKARSPFTPVQSSELRRPYYSRTTRRRHVSDPGPRPWPYPYAAPPSTVNGGRPAAAGRGRDIAGGVRRRVIEPFFHRNPTTGPVPHDGIGSWRGAGVRLNRADGHQCQDDQVRTDPG